MRNAETCTATDWHRRVKLGVAGHGDERRRSVKEISVKRVDHPDYYRANGIEAIDIIEAYGLNFGLGNVIKYVLRAGRKDPDRRQEDLEKALWYLGREVRHGRE